MIALLSRLFGWRRPGDDPVIRCYGLVVEQARRPILYQRYGVPDTLDGRFDLLALHAFLVSHRLKRQGEPARRFSRCLLETMITDMDQSVREMGGGDMGAAPRVKRMAKGFNGRIHAYDRGLSADGDEALLAALDNNLYGTVLEPAPELVAGMAAYVREAAAALAAQPLEGVLAGAIQFPDPCPAGRSA